MQPHKVAHSQVLPVLLDPRRPVVSLANTDVQVRLVKVDAGTRLLLGVGVSSRVGRAVVELGVFGVVGIVVALEALVTSGDGRFVRETGRRVGARATLGGSLRADCRRPRAVTFLSRCLNRSSARRSARKLQVAEPIALFLRLDILDKRRGFLLRNLAIPALSPPNSHRPLPPEPLVLLLPELCLLALFLLSLLDEPSLSPPVPDELGQSERPALLEGQVRVVVGPAEGDDFDVVDRAVGLVALEVLVAVFDRRDEDDDDEREGRETRVDGREAREELKNDEDCKASTLSA